MKIEHLDNGCKKFNFIDEDACFGSFAHTLILRIEGHKSRIIVYEAGERWLTKYTARLNKLGFVVRAWFAGSDAKSEPFWKCN